MQCSAKSPQILPPAWLTKDDENEIKYSNNPFCPETIPGKCQPVTGRGRICSGASHTFNVVVRDYRLFAAFLRLALDPEYVPPGSPLRRDR